MCQCSPRLWAACSKLKALLCNLSYHHIVSIVVSYRFLIFSAHVIVNILVSNPCSCTKSSEAANLHQATHSCACPSFGRLDICISQRSRGEDSHTVCSQWSSWSCVPPMRGLSSLYRWFARLSLRISPDSLLAFSLNCTECTQLGIE